MRPPSPGQPMLLQATVLCDCGWQGVDLDRAGALSLWTEHALRAGHDLTETAYTEGD